MSEEKQDKKTTEEPEKLDTLDLTKAAGGYTASKTRPSATKKSE